MAAQGANDSFYKFRLNGIDLWLDRQTGSIEYLSSPSTGVLLEGTREQSGLLDVANPTSKFTPLRLASRFSQTEIQHEGENVEIRWQALGPSRSNFAPHDGSVSAQVTIRPAQDGKSLVLSCQIQNHSKAPIPQILFPDLWGLVPFHGIEGTELRFARGVVRPFAIPYRRPDAAPPYYENIGWQQYPSEGGYYTQNALRWLDFGGLGGGLSAFQRKWGTQDRPDVLTYRSERDPMHLRLAWQHKGPIEPGQTWESGEFWLTPHPGGWAKGIEVYRDYVRQANPPRAVPAHIRDGLGYQTIWMTQAPEKDPEKVYFCYRDLPRVAQDSLQYGLDELVPWFWNANYFNMPIRSSPLLGTERELLEGIEKARTMGVNVAPFVSIHIIMNDAVARYGVKPGHDDWTYHPELIPEFRPYFAHDLEGTFVDDDNLVWQEDARAALSEWVKRGMSSLSFDQFVYKETPGQKPGLIKIIEAVRALARSEDPQSTFSSESCTDLELDSSILDYTWNWIGPGIDALNQTVDAGPLVSILRSPRLNCNIDDSPMAVKKCFAEGLFLNVMPSKVDEPNGTALISEKPPLASALKSVAALHKLFLPYFTEGDALGESVLARPAPAFVRAYSLGEGLLVFVLNDRPEAQRVVLGSDLSIWLPASGGHRENYYNQDGKLLRDSPLKDTSWLGMTDLLQPGEMAVFEIRHQ
ncbi:MAG TPA: hypothetical protein VEN79_11240 [Terriglobia bacterium]|nr:hypothetical protein [Terriglobia bacterium]